MALSLTNGGSFVSSNASGLPVSTAGFSMTTWLNYAFWSTAPNNASMVTMHGIASGTGVQIGSRSGGANSAYVWAFGGAALVQSSSVTVPSNGWVHIAYTCSALSAGNQTHSVYVNGVLGGTSTNALLGATSFNYIQINGFYGGGTSETATFLVDDTAIYNRVLSANEITTIYACAGMRDGITYGLNSRYKFNEAATGGTMATCMDFAGSGNTLTPNTTPAPTYASGISLSDTKPAF